MTSCAVGSGGLDRVSTILLLLMRAISTYRSW
jgi:hypothetical protein